MENISTPSPAPRKPYRLWLDEKRFYTMDVMAESADAAMKFALDHDGLWSDVDASGESAISDIIECQDADFVAVNQ